MIKKLPTNAILAVTLNCNSRCKMCDIWKNRITNELMPKEYKKLPRTLKDINITGGEPFLRMDLPEIIEALKEIAPFSRLVISTNGFLPKLMKKQVPQILKIDKNIAIRLSLDGWKKTHDRIRGIPNGFNLVLESLKICKQAGVKDLGIGFTIMKDNLKDLIEIYEFTKNEEIELSLSLVTSSPIYFGMGKDSLRPDNHNEVVKQLNRVIIKRFKSIKPKEWFRGWFEQQLLKFYLDNKRPYICDAGSSFFYLDSIGNIYTCNIKGWLLGNIRKDPFYKIWNSKQANTMRKRVRKCDDCWMICSAKTNMRSNLIKISSEVFGSKIRLLWAK